MSEQLVIPAEAAAQPIHLETADQAVNRLQNSLQFIPYDQVTEDNASNSTVTYMGSKNPDGSYMWTRSFTDTPAGNYEAVNTAKSEELPIFEQAADTARQNTSLMRSLARQEGRWWLSSSAEAAVETGLQEAFRVQEGDRQIDVLNCSNERFADRDKQAIENVMNAVANFTGGKVFDRVKGIVFADQSYFKDGVAGDYQHAAGTIRINIASLANRAQLGRYTQYFEEGQTDFLEIILAHEIGHAMDIASLDEVENHNIDANTVVWSAFGGRTSDFSAMQQLPSWNPYTYKENPNSTFEKTAWAYNDAGAIECREDAPTGYATTNPQEDFAESFAIAALGGDVSKMPWREAIIGETIKKAYAEATIGPKQVSVQQIDLKNGYPLHKISAVPMKVLVSPGVPDSIY
jgi:hypothetical protein